MFPPAQRVGLVEKLEIHYTLNMQCPSTGRDERGRAEQHPLSQRIGTQAELQRQVELGSSGATRKAVTVDWRFTPRMAPLSSNISTLHLNGKGRTPVVGLPT